MEASQNTDATQLALQTACIAPPPPQDAAAEKAVGKPARQRRGPPADGKDEERENVLLTTSKLSGPGGKLRRGQAVSVPTRRLTALVQSGKVRQATAEELETAIRRFGLGRLG